MRILHVIPAIAPRYGGPSRAIIEMCAALQRQGIDLLVATTDADKNSRLPVTLGEPTTYKDVPMIFFARQWTEAFKYSQPLTKWLNRNVKDFDAVHIHAVFSHSSLAAARACRRQHVPYIVRPLGSLVPWGLSQKRFRKRVFMQLGVKRMLEAASAIHYTTLEEKRTAEHALNLTNGVVIPLGTSEEAFQVSTEPDGFRRKHPALETDPFVLVLCRLHPVKGLELFLDVFLEATQCKEFQKWRLVLAGDGEPEYVGSLKRLVRECGEESRVLFAGWVEGADKFAALRDADLMALPSFQESFGLSVVEALACGTPVLISANVALADEVKAAGAGWVAPLERSVLLNALNESLEDESERRQRGEMGRELVKRRFLWSAVAAELETLYSDIKKSYS